MTIRQVIAGLFGVVLAVAALYAVFWNSERSCGSAGYCGMVWLAFGILVLPAAAVGFGIGMGVSGWLSRRREDRSS